MVPALGTAGDHQAMISELADLEEFRLSLSPVTGVALSQAEAELAEARTVLGLETRAEPDGQPHCDWCGRSDPPGGLRDESLGGPEVHACADTDGCVAARADRESAWIDSQHPDWRVDWAKYLTAQQYERELAEQKWQTGDLYRNAGYQLTGDEADPEFLAALSMLRDMVDERVPGFLEGYDSADEPVELSAPWPAIYNQPAAPPPWAMFDPWGHTMRNPAHRHHTLGHMRASHQGVHSAADALGRKAVSALYGKFLIPAD